MQNKHKFHLLAAIIVAFLSIPLASANTLEPTNTKIGDTYSSEVELPFTDEATIPNFARESIKFLYDENIMRGNSDGSFAAHRNINRAEIAKIIIESTDTKKYVPLASSFPDIGLDDWFFPYVETGRVLGWWGGYPNGLFKPGAFINRAEIAKVLAEAFDLDVTERSGEGWYEKYFRALAENGLLAYGTTLENPGAGITPSRAEVAEQVFRFRKYKSQEIHGEEEEVMVDLIEDNETEDDDEPKTITDYTPPQTDEVDYEYVDTNALSQKIDSLAGKMYVEKVPSLVQKNYVNANQSGVELLKLKIRSAEGTLRVRSLQVKVSGNGTYQMLSRMWITDGAQDLSLRVHPQSDLVQIDLNEELVLTSGQSKTLVFKANIDALVDTDDRVRVALFLPTWISANTNKKIGFFPFSGSDVIVK